QPHVAEIERRRLVLAVSEVPSTDIRQDGGRAVGVLQLVQTDADFVLPRLEDNRLLDARIVVRATGVEDVQSELDDVLARVEDIDAQRGERLPVLDLRDPVADGVALEEGDLEGLSL